MAYPFLQDFIREFLGFSVYFPIPTFGTFFAISVLISYWLLKKELIRIEAQNNLLKSKHPKFSSQALSGLMSDFSFQTLMAGIIGARLFHILEYPKEFLSDPIGMLFSTGGLTVIGGMLLGTLSGIYFLKKRQYPVLPVADAAAPAMMLGYAIGRIGCQLSGDGDWGLLANMELKPSWLPNWLWAQQYHNNVINQIIPFPGVYPTPIYESLLGFLIFLFLWRLRKNNLKPGVLFSIYLLFSGVERLAVEQIRINSKYHFLNYGITQAELLSSISIVLGIVGCIYFNKKYLKQHV